MKEACLEANIPIGIFGLNAEALRPFIEQDFTMIVAGVDTVLLPGAATALVTVLRGPANSTAASLNRLFWSR